MSRGRWEAPLLGLACLFLAAGGAYGLLAEQPERRTEGWNGPPARPVVSGYCFRRLSLLPRTDVRAPDFIRIGDRTYIRGEREVPRPPGLLDTGWWYGPWSLDRARGEYYLEWADNRLVLPYRRGDCRDLS